MAVTTFIPELWSARLIHALDETHVAAKLVNRRYEGIIRAQGDTVHINSIGAVTVSDYEANTDIGEPQLLSVDDQTLVIDQAKYFNFQVDDVDAAQAAGDLIDAAMGRAAQALGSVSDAYILQTMADGAGTVIGGDRGMALNADNVYAQIVALRTVMDKNNVPENGRCLVIPPDVYALLLMDDRFVKASDGAVADDVLLRGSVGQAAGFRVWMSNNLPKDDDVFTVLALVPDAVTYAEQVVQPEAYRMEKRFADGVKGLHVYGCRVTEPAAVTAMHCTV